MDENGLVSVEDVKNAIRPDTVLISIMAANNEIGTIEPIREIGKVAHEAGVLFHTDAVQAVGAVPIDVNDWNVDMLSLSGHKFHAPKGIGALYIRKGVKISNLIFGGAQERGLRAGTENLPGIVGLGAAIELAVAELPEYTRRLTALTNDLISLTRMEEAGEELQMSAFSLSDLTQEAAQSFQGMSLQKEQTFNLHITPGLMIRGDEKMLARDGSRRLKKFAEENEKQEFRQITQGVWYVCGMGHSNAAFCRGQDGRDPHRHAGYIRAGEKTGRAHSKAAGKESENDPLYAQPIRPPGRRGDVCGK